MSPLDPPSLPRRLAASRRVPLVGRRLELETLEHIWADVEDGHRQVVFVGGEPGAGKTRLLAEVAGALHDHGTVVLVGSSDRETGVPYRPFAEMLDHLFGTAPPGALAGPLAGGGRELRRLSAEVDRHLPGVDHEEPPAGDVRRDLFEAVARLLRGIAEERPVALLLDDLHWAQPPTLALLEHVVQACAGTRLLVFATFRTTAPDRSDALAGRVAELHRLEGVRRLDLGGLDTEAIAEYLSLQTGLPMGEARPPAALLRDRTGGNPFFLRELWADLERHGGVTALRSSRPVPASIGDTLTARLAGLGEDVREVIELAAVLGDTFDLATLTAASAADRSVTLAGVDSAVSVGLMEPVEAGGRCSFVHALTRQAVLEAMPHARRTLLHARAGEALERQPRTAAIVPQLAHHFLSAHPLGFHDEALRYTREAGRLAERMLAFEDAASWFQRAASLPECDPEVRGATLLSAAANHVRACNFPQARALYEELGTDQDPSVRLAAAMGFENASWRPGLIGERAADLLAAALGDGVLDTHEPRYVQALGSFGRALALAGETDRARQVGGRAVELARALGDEPTLVHALTTSLWALTAPAVAELQLARTTEVQRMARTRRDHETLGAAVNFGATVSYLLGLPEELERAVSDSFRAAQGTGQPYYRHVYHCLAHAAAFLRGDFAEAQVWTDKTIEDTFGDEMTEGPHAVQTFMVRRETGALRIFGRYLDGEESFTGRWVPGLLALYNEVGNAHGTRRALHHLLEHDRPAATEEAQWPMELVFMVEGALSLGDADAVRSLRPLLGAYEGKNLVSGTLIATFGSADRYLARVAAHLGDGPSAERHFGVALAMDRRMRSTVHVAETLAHQARFAADEGRRTEACELAGQARALAEPIGQERVLRLLDGLVAPARGTGSHRPGAPDRAHAAPDWRAPADSAAHDGLTERELAVLRLLAAGLSNQEIGAQLHISGNTAANHVRSILMKTGAANRTQAAMYAAQRNLA